MTFIHDLLRQGSTLSFEFFPPKTAEGRLQLDETVAALEPLSPSFVSVTYGAGGSTRDLTRDLVVRLDGETAYPVMPHLTCIGHTRDEIATLLSEYRDAGITNVLALAGDPPIDGSEAAGDFTYASELVEFARSHGDFSIGVAAFAEGHPRSTSLDQDRRHLASKLEQADFGISQFFFRLDDYLRMIDDVQAFGCEVPVLPGVIPLVNPATIRRFAAMNNTTFPEHLAQRIEAASPEDGRQIAIDAAVELCDGLRSHGVPGLHLYCLNRADVVVDVVRQLGA